MLSFSSFAHGVTLRSLHCLRSASQSSHKCSFCNILKDVVAIRIDLVTPLVTLASVDLEDENKLFFTTDRLIEN